MMLVTDHPGENSGALGIVSLEDVIEELIGEEIIDETDLFLDVANKIKVVRRPQIRTGAAKKLTPLLKGRFPLICSVILVPVVEDPFSPMQTPLQDGRQPVRTVMHQVKLILSLQPTTVQSAARM